MSRAGASRTAVPAEAVAEPGKDGGAQSQGGRYGRNVRVCRRFVYGVLTPREVRSLGDT